MRVRMTELKDWLAHRAPIDHSLYERFGRPLEPDHSGQFVAIGPDGQTIVGPSAAEVLEHAIAKFGSGNFALNRVGHRTFGRWLVGSG